jgi:membrane protein YqaA with SNARE-associated domain
MSPISVSREDWLRRANAFSKARWGTALLALIAFADSSVLPVLPDLLLVPMLLLRPERTWLLTAVCVAASSAGALVGYAIGHLAWSAFGQTLVEMYGQRDNFLHYQQLIKNWGIWIIIAKSFTPIPFKFIAIAAGLASMNLITFTIATVIGRALHFAIVALLVAYLGQKFLRSIEVFERYGRWLVVFGIVAAIGVGVARLLR